MWRNLLLNALPLRKLNEDETLPCEGVLTKKELIAAKVSKPKEK